MAQRNDRPGVTVPIDAAAAAAAFPVTDDRMAPRNTSGPKLDNSVKCNTDARDTMAMRFARGRASKSSLLAMEMGTSKISFQDGLHCGSLESTRKSFVVVCFSFVKLLT